MSGRRLGRRSLRTVTVLAMALLASALGPVTPAAAAPPYRTGTYDLVALEWDQLSFHDGVVPGLPAAPPTDAEGIPMIRWHDGRLYYGPARSPSTA